MNHRFVPSGSKDLDEPVTVINGPLIAIGPVLKAMVDKRVPAGSALSPVIYAMMHMIINGQTPQELFTKRTPRELFYGYRDPTLDKITTMMKPIETIFGVNEVMPQAPPNNTFGFFYGRNNTPDGPWEVYTGLYGTEDWFNHVYSWKNQG